MEVTAREQCVADQRRRGPARDHLVAAGGTRGVSVRGALGLAAVGQQLAVDLADGGEFLARVGDLFLGVLQMAAQLVGALASGLELVGDVAAERFGQALLERASCSRSRWLCALLGDWNWYLPSWLEWLPRSAPNTTPRRPSAPTDAPEPDGTHVPEEPRAAPAPA
jgi:hypothetical protein